MSYYQLEKPISGDTVAIMHTTMGDIKIKLFKNETPKTYENFTTHAKNGYYNGLIFHRLGRRFLTVEFFGGGSALRKKGISRTPVPLAQNNLLFKP